MTAAYASLVERIRRMTALRDAAEMLTWDQQVMMPPGGTEGRAAQLSALHATQHELLVAPETGRLLAEAEKAETDPERVALLREVRVAHDRAARVPMELVEKMSTAATRGYEAWVEARRASDYARFRPHLEELLELRRRYAHAVDPDVPAYEALFQDYEPWVPLAEARKNLRALRDGLRPIVERAREAPPEEPAVFRGKWPAAAQLAASTKLVALIGYDFHHGRLDTSPHPFSAGGPYDARITTRWEESSPLQGILAALHEAGHAMYMQGLPKEHHGTPLGDARDLVVHESQSRLWENHVGRSMPFWERALPVLRDAFPGMLKGATPEDAWRAANHVTPSLIRVYADEITYHMHIALRFEMEEALVTNALALDEAPHRWNETMQRDLGVTPPDHAQGILQDMHWSGGAFGYFPTYSLGSMLSAQLMEAYAAQGGAPDDYKALLGWLRENVHRHGKRFTTGELVERATGKPLAPDAFLRYARDKMEQLAAA